MAKKHNGEFDLNIDDFEFFPLDGSDNSLFEDRPKLGIGGYAKNVLKSVRNLGVSLADAIHPSITEGVREMGAVITESKDIVVEQKDKLMEQIQKFRGNEAKPLKETAGNFVKEIGDDLLNRFKTGKFFKSDYFIDMDDFDFDMGFGDDDSGSSVTEPDAGKGKVEKDPNAPKEVRIRRKKFKQYAFEVENQRTKYIGDAVVGASQASIAASIDIYNKSQLMHEAHAHVTHAYLKNIATNIYKLTNINLQSMQAQVEYGKKDLAFTQEMTAMIKDLHQINVSIYKKQQDSMKKNKANSMREVFGMGFSGSNYAQGIFQNAKDMLSNNFALSMMLGMLPMMNMGEGMGMKQSPAKMAMSMFNPFTLLATMGLDSQSKKGIERLSKMFSALPVLFNRKMGGWAMEGGIKGFIGELLNMKSTEATASVEKYSDMNLDSPTAFDVRTKRTINEVIPAYLAQIAAGVTGREETRYDFKSQTFKNVSSLAKLQQDSLKHALKSDYQFNELNTKLNTKAFEILGANTNKKTQTKAEKRAVDDYYQGFESIQRSFVQMNRNFDLKEADNDLKRANDGKDFSPLLTRLTRYIKGDKKFKLEVLNAWLSAYGDDKVFTADDRQFYNAASANVQMNLQSSNESSLRHLMTNFSSGGSIVAGESIAQREADIDQQITELERLRKNRRNDGFLGEHAKQLRDTDYQRKIAALKEQKRALRAEMGNSAVGIGKLSLDNENDYVMEQRFLSVPNMLKNITELLVQGIIVYPQNDGIPKHVKRNLQNQSKYLSNQTKQAIKSIKEQREYDEELRTASIEASKRSQEAAYEWRMRDRLSGVDDNSTIGKIKRAYNRKIQQGNNFLRSFLSIFGFNNDYDFTKSEAENAEIMGAEGYQQKQNPLRQFVDKYKDSSNPVAKKAAFALDVITGKADLYKVTATTKEKAKKQFEEHVKKIEQTLKPRKEKLQNFKETILEEVNKYKEPAERNAVMNDAINKFVQNEMTQKIINKLPEEQQQMINDAVNGINEPSSGKGSIIDQAKEAFGNIIDAGKEKLGSLKEKSVKLLEDFKKDPKDFLEKNIKNKSDIVIKKVRGQVEVRHKETQELIATFKKSDKYEQIKEKFERVRDRVGDLKESGSSFFESAKEKGAEYLDIAKNKGSEYYGIAKEKLGSLKENASGFFQSLTSGVQSTVNGFRLGPIYDKLDTIISLLTAMAGKDMNPEDLKKLQESVTKESNPKKRSLISRILTSPFWLLKKGIMGGAGILGTGIGAIGNFFGKALPGVGSAIGGAAKGGFGLLGKAAGGLFGLGKKAAGKVLGIPGAVIGGVGSLFRMKKSSVDKKLLKLSLDGGISVDSILSTFDRDELIKMVAAVLDKKPDDEKINNMSDDKLAKELIKYWKKSGSKKGGAGDVAKGVGSAIGGAAKGAGSFFGGLIKAGAQVASTAGGAIANFATATLGRVGDALFGRGKVRKHALKNFEKGVLSNLISIRSILEREYGPADKSAVDSEMVDYSKGPDGIIRRAVKGVGSIIAAPFKGVFNLGKKAFNGIKSGFKGRKEGSSIREGSYEDLKLDKQEALEEERKESDSKALGIIAMNTTLIAKKISNFQPGDGEQQLQSKGPGWGKQLLGGLGNILLGGAALYFGNKARNHKRDLYEEDVANGMDVDVDKESTLDNIEYASIIPKAIRAITKGIYSILNIGPIKKVIGKKIIDTVGKLIVKIITKAAPRLAPRLFAFMGSAASGIGLIVNVVAAGVGFTMGMARADHYFRSYLQPGQTVTFPMRLASGLVKALDGLLFGIPSAAAVLALHKELIVVLYDVLLKNVSWLPLTKEKQEAEEQAKNSTQLDYSNDAELTEAIEPSAGAGVMAGAQAMSSEVPQFNADQTQVGIETQKPSTMNVTPSVATHAAQTAAATVGLQGGKGYLQSKPLVQNLYPNQSPSPYIVPNPQQSAGGARADVVGLSPILRDRLTKFAQHYYDITGKPLQVNSAKRSMEQQIKMWEAQAKTKYTGNREADTKRAGVAGGKFFGYRGGTVAYPNKWSSHMMGNAVDIDIKSTPFDSEVNDQKRHWLFDDVLEQYGLRRTLVSANGYSGSSRERWHVGLMQGHFNIPKNQPPEEPPEASLQEQKKDGLAVATATTVNKMDFMEPQSTSGTSVSEVPAYTSQATTATNIAGSQMTTGTSSNGSVSSTSTGATGMASTASSVNDTAGLMGKVEENTRKTYEVLAQHLPNLDAMTKILTAILAATASGANNSGGGLSSINNPVGSLSTMLAVGK